MLFTTSPEAIGHLAREGRPAASVHFVGNPMIDTLLANLGKFDAAAARRDYGLDGRYVVATLHRPANVDSPERARELVQALHEVAAQVATLGFVALINSQLLPVPFAFNPVSLAAMLVFTFVIASLASVLPALRAAHVRIADTLRYE